MKLIDMFVAIDLEERIACVPVGIVAEWMSGVLSLNNTAYEMMKMTDQNMSVTEISQVLNSIYEQDPGLQEKFGEAPEAEIVAIEGIEYDVIKDLCEKAEEGECSQYTYMDLVKRLSKVLGLD